MQDKPLEPRDEDARDEPLVDVTPAIGEAGHEVEDLGFEDVADTGDITGPPTTQPDPRDEEIAADYAIEWPSD